MDIKRRKLVTRMGAGVIVFPLVSFAGAVTAADAPKLDPNSAQAQALGYMHKSKTPAKTCKGCQFFSDAKAVWGPCLIFPGTWVSAEGTCNSWVQRSG